MKCIELIVTKMDTVVDVRARGRLQIIAPHTASVRGRRVGLARGRGLAHAPGGRRGSATTRDSVYTLQTSSHGWTNEILREFSEDMDL